MQSENKIEAPLVELPKTPPGERHMSVDMATLSQQPDAVIGSLAWIVFDPKDTGGANDSFFKTVDWDQRERTYNWPHIQQLMLKSGMARRAVVNFSQPIPLLAAVTSVAENFTKHRCSAIWGTRPVLNTLENAFRYCKKDIPWAPGQARDLTTCWSTGLDLGTVSEIERHETEPQDVPLGNAAFVARAVRHIYQAVDTTPPPPDSKVA